MNREEITEKLINQHNELKDKKDVSFIEKMKPLQLLYHYQFIWCQEELNNTFAKLENR